MREKKIFINKVIQTNVFIFTRKIIKVCFQKMSIYLKNIVIFWILDMKAPIKIYMFHNKWTAPSWS
jgi:hypothetical protein